MKTVLFPTDFSASVADAMDFAIQYCLDRRARLVIQHSYFAMAQETGLSNEVMQSLIVNAEHDAEHSRKKMESELKAKYPSLDFEFHVKFGFPVDNITEAAEHFKADLIIMATKGAHGLIDKIAGTVTMGVAESVKVPVLAIPYGHKMSQIDQLLYATTYDEKDRVLLHQALDFAKNFNAHIQAIHVIEPYEPQIDRATDLAARFKGYFADHNIQFRNLHREEVEGGIQTYVQNHKPDVLILAHKHRGFWSSLFHTSVTKYFAHHAQLPLLIFPA